MAFSYEEENQLPGLFSSSWFLTRPGHGHGRASISATYEEQTKWAWQGLGKQGPATKDQGPLAIDCHGGPGGHTLGSLAVWLVSPASGLVVREEREHQTRLNKTMVMPGPRRLPRRQLHC